MTTAAARKVLGQAYFQDPRPTGFFSSLFTVKPGGFHETESIEIDIHRTDEEVAIAVKEYSQGFRSNSDNLFTNKEFKPPIFKESFPVNAWDLMKNRLPGENPFASADFQRRVTTKAMSGFRLIESKILRSIELQASSILQSGTLTMVDGSGATMYSIDYKPKSAHFPTAGTAWSGAANPLGDIGALAAVIRKNGKVNPDQLIFGTTAFAEFCANTEVKARLDLRRADMIQINPLPAGVVGGQFRGTVDIDNYKFDMYTVEDYYKHPQTGTITPFMGAEKVIVRASQGRMDKSFGACPLVVPPDSRVLPYLPERMNNRDVDFFTNAWVSRDNTVLEVGIMSRPLCIPVAIDTFGCIST